jgi:membrane-bound lytic murein transglycosylase D
MHRHSVLALLALAACGGHAVQPVAPVAPVVPDASPTAGAPAPSGADAGAGVGALPPAPVADSVLDRELARELARELRNEADSAADEAVLERIASESPPIPESDTPVPEETAPAAPHAATALTGSAVTFDIDVERFNNHGRVQYYLDFFQDGARERFGIWLNRMPRYEPMIRRRLHEHGLPGDLVYLALIESGFSNSATSRSRAVGMWQFMKGTARLYGLRIDRWVDERRDPIKATDAAVRHLKDLTDTFGSYYLAAAAYNAGAGKVSRSLVRLPEDENDSIPSDATFFRLYDTKLLRRETKDYVPKLIAAAIIAKDPSRYGFTVEPATQVEPYDSIVVRDMAGLDVIARLADTSLAAVRELNPQFLRLVTPPSGVSVVRLPPGRGAAAALAYAELPANRRVNFREHLTHGGETLGGIARRYGVSTAELIAANPRLRARTLHAGQRLIVPTSGALTVEVARALTAPEPREAVFHRVRRGETLGLIAARYGVSQRQLRAWNGMGGSNLVRIGRRLRVAPPPTRVAAARPAGRPTTPDAVSISHEGSAPKLTEPVATGQVSSTPRPLAMRTHLVRRGETLAGLARRYGVSIQALREANGLSDAATIKRGTRLKIPA